jgi:adenine-specific DNA-methyltransferase
LICEDNSKIIDFDNIIFREVISPQDSSWQNLFLSYDLHHEALLGLIEQGFEIGIGVATGADKVFIKRKSDLNGIEKSRLIPIIKSTDLKNNKFKWGEQYVINPYENDVLCDLNKYPHLNNYLNENKVALLRRHTAQKSPDHWYKTIDKIKPNLQHKPKLLLPDLTGNKILFIDEGNFYPHHNIYYITGKDIASLKVIGSILMSEFVRSQMGQIGIRMNGGLPRYQSQVLKKIKVPNIKLIKLSDKNELINSYEKQDTKNINRIVEKFCNEKGIYSLIKKSFDDII